MQKLFNESLSEDILVGILGFLDVLEQQKLISEPLTPAVEIVAKSERFWKRICDPLGKPSSEAFKINSYKVLHADICKFGASIQKNAMNVDRALMAYYRYPFIQPIIRRVLYGFHVVLNHDQLRKDHGASIVHVLTKMISTLSGNTLTNALMVLVVAAKPISTQTRYSRPPTEFYTVGAAQAVLRRMNELKSDEWNSMLAGAACWSLVNLSLCMEVSSIIGAEGFPLILRTLDNYFEDEFAVERAFFAIVNLKDFSFENAMRAGYRIAELIPRYLENDGICLRGAQAIQTLNQFHYTVLEVAGVKRALKMIIDNTTQNPSQKRREAVVCVELIFSRASMEIAEDERDLLESDESDYDETMYDNSIGA
eukprot:TRINITY_DN11845_c0_g1_i1.p1 TRINITY_DN11845_c0_g1~~TRINITY_DN11845_c0_g1_i1.p1  ORF type:complete len:367 (+),score=69.49 TRINITY_DN11845_c0_g1_i1:157-1257(+)